MAEGGSAGRPPFWKRRTLWINLALVVVIGVVLLLIASALRPQPEAAPARTATVERGDVIRTVTATGAVESAEPLALSFATVGVVESVDVAEGDVVSAGEVLATVDSTVAEQQLATARLSLAQATDAVASSSASRGSSATAVANARTSLEQAKATRQVSNDRLDEAVKQAEANLAVARNLWSPACLTPDTGGCPNPSAASAIRAAEGAVSSAKIAHDQAVAAAAAAIAGYTTAVDQARARLDQAKSAQGTTCDTLGSDSPNCLSAKSTTLAAQQTYDNAVTSRTSGTTADNGRVEATAQSLSAAQVTLQKTQNDLAKVGDDAVRNASQALTTAKSARTSGKAQNAQAVQQAQAALDSAVASQVAGTTGTSALDAAVASARAGVKAAERVVEQTKLTAPVAGTVSDVSINAGELTTASGTLPAITLVPEQQVQVVADFAEADAADISVGDAARVTFEALPGIEAQGQVTAIATASSTSTSGLVTYEVRLALSEVPAGVLPGMTASIAVTVDEATGVLVLPQGAITTEAGTSRVELLGAENSRTVVEVTTGVQGDVTTEVTTGVGEGDVIVIPSADDGVGLSFPGGGPPGENRPPASGAS